MPRACAACGQSLFKRDFSANQWFKGEGTSRCKACVKRRATALSPARVRQLAQSAHLVEISHNKASKVISFERMASASMCTTRQAQSARASLIPRKAKRSSFAVIKTPKAWPRFSGTLACTLVRAISKSEIATVMAAPARPHMQPPQPQAWSQAAMATTIGRQRCVRTLRECSSSTVTRLCARKLHKQGPI